MRDRLLKVRYIPIEGTDPEHGQAVVERNQLRQNRLAQFEWLILVEAPGDPAEWQARLNAAADPRQGRFTVDDASPEVVAQARAGRIKFQR